MRIVEIVGSIFAIFLAFGFVPIVAGALILSLLGHRVQAENVFIFGFAIWIGARSWVGWRSSVAWRKSEAQRIAEGRDSPADVRRREGWEAKKLRRREYLRAAMCRKDRQP